MSNLTQTKSTESIEDIKKKTNLYDCIGIAYSSYVLLIVSAATVIRVSHSTILSVASEGVIHDLKLSDGLFGAISGPISSIGTIIFGIVVGRFTDLFSRKWLLFACIIVWSSFHALTGFCQNHWHLVFVKLGAAAGMGKTNVCFNIKGGLNPISFSILTDYFRPTTRAIAFGVHGTSFIFGVGVAYAFGIMLTESSTNWRNIFFISAVPGAILAIFTFFTVKEPERGGLDPLNDLKKPANMTKLLKYLVKSPSVIVLGVTAPIGFLGLNAIANFTSLFYRRIHHMEPNEISLHMAWISPLAGLSGSLVSSIACMILQKYTSRGYAIVCLVGAICNAPFQTVSLLIDDPYVSLFLYLPSSFFTFMVLIPINLILIQIVPVSGRGFAIGVLGVIATGVGSLGPLVVGLMNSYNFPVFDSAENPLALRWSLLSVHIVTRVIIIVGCFLLVFVLPYDIKALEEYYIKNSEEVEKAPNKESEQVASESESLIQ